MDDIKNTVTPLTTLLSLPFKYAIKQKQQQLYDLCHCYYIQSYKHKRTEIGNFSVNDGTIIKIFIKNPLIVDGNNKPIIIVKNAGFVPIQNLSLAINCKTRTGLLPVENIHIKSLQIDEEYEFALGKIPVSEVNFFSNGELKRIQRRFYEWCTIDLMTLRYGVIDLDESREIASWMPSSDLNATIIQHNGDFYNLELLVDNHQKWQGYCFRRVSEILSIRGSEWVIDIIVRRRISDIIEHNAAWLFHRKIYELCIFTGFAKIDLSIRGEL